jgi:hypothetical protein
MLREAGRLGKRAAAQGTIRWRENEIWTISRIGHTPFCALGGRVRSIPRCWGVDTFASNYCGDLLDCSFGKRFKIIVKNLRIGVSGILRWGTGLARLVLVLGVAACSAQGQQPPAAGSAGGAPASGQEKAPAVKPVQHRFWDRENLLLFAGVGVGRGLDYASTLNIRRRGINEVLLTNAIVDNHPLFAGIEVGGTAASIGVSYIFHATGHHTLERWTSIVHFGVAVGGAARNYALKTPHPD